jgi:hypothetical protein
MALHGMLANPVHDDLYQLLKLTGVRVKLHVLAAIIHAHGGTGLDLECAVVVAGRRPRLHFD